MWTAITAFWQNAPSLGSLVVVMLGVTAVPAALVLRTWLIHRADNRRARTEQYKAETDRLAKMRELETAHQKMLLEAQLQRDNMLAENNQPEIPFPFPRRGERPAITSTDAEAA
jgi:hypothetical protein